MNTQSLSRSAMLTQSLTALLQTGISNYVSAEVATVAKKAQEFAMAGNMAAAYSVLSSELKFEPHTTFQARKFTSVGQAQIIELFDQQTTEIYGQSNIKNRKVTEDTLVFGIKLLVAEGLPILAVDGVKYNNLTGSFHPSIQNSEFELHYNGGIILNEPVSEFTYENDGKFESEANSFYQLPAPVVIKKENQILPLIKTSSSTAYAPAVAGNALFIKTMLKGIKIHVRTNR